MKKILVALIVLLFVTSAHAGFLTGAVVGYVVGSDGKREAQPNTTISSKEHDVIVCEKVSISNYPDGCEPHQLCEVPNPDYGKWFGGNNTTIQTWCPTSVDAFIHQQGYTKLFKRGVQFIDRHEYIIMEVGK
jgi:hypothetical protein